MPAYDKQIGILDRWAIVAYVKALQRSQHAKPEDVPENRTRQIQVGCVKSTHRSAAVPAAKGGQAFPRSGSSRASEEAMQATTTTPTDAQRAQWHLGPLPFWTAALAWIVGMGGCWIATWLQPAGELGGSMFAHAYLVAFTFYLSIALGALFFVMLHHLSRAGWSVTLRRVAEALSANLIFLAPLGLLLLPSMFELDEWSRPGAAYVDPKLAAKVAYLNPTAFMLRMAGYFIVWVFLAWFFRSRSIRQDASGDVRLSGVMERMSAPGMIAWGVTVTLAAVDLLMSLQPHWYSTMIGVYFFSGSVLAGLVALVIVARWLQACGRLVGAVTTEHYHDLGKLIFALSSSGATSPLANTC